MEAEIRVAGEAVALLMAARAPGEPLARRLAVLQQPQWLSRVLSAGSRSAYRYTGLLMARPAEGLGAMARAAVLLLAVRVRGVTSDEVRRVVPSRSRAFVAARTLPLLVAPKAVEAAACRSGLVSVGETPRMNRFSRRRNTDRHALASQCHGRGELRDRGLSLRTDVT